MKFSDLVGQDLCRACDISGSRAESQIYWDITEVYSAEAIIQATPLARGRFFDHIREKRDSLRGGLRALVSTDLEGY